MEEDIFKIKKDFSILASLYMSYFTWKVLFLARIKHFGNYMCDPQVSNTLKPKRWLSVGIL